MTVQELEVRRERCLAGMRAIRSMRRGTSSEPYGSRSRQGSKTRDARPP
jgi:hypothetical protein